MLAKSWSSIAVFGVILAASPAQGGLIFVANGHDYAGFVQLGPGTDFDEVDSSTLGWTRTSSATVATLDMTGRLSVEASSSTGFSDQAMVGYWQAATALLAVYDGSGPQEAYLNYTISVQGWYQGQGGYAAGNTWIHGLVGGAQDGSGSLVNEVFHDNRLVEDDVEFNFPWDVSEQSGRLRIGPSDVTPRFYIPDHWLDANTSNWATMTNIWAEAHIELELVEIPEPGTLVLFGVASIAVLGWRRA